MTLLPALLQPYRRILHLLPLLLLLQASYSEGKDFRTIDNCFRNERIESPDPNFSKNIAKFSLKLFRSIVSSSGSSGSGSGSGGSGSGGVVVAGYSVWSALVVAYLAAEGVTKQELERALKFQSKISTHQDWNLLERRLTNTAFRSSLHPATPTQAQSKQARQTSAEKDITITLTDRNSQTQADSETSSDSQTKGGGNSNIQTSSDGRVQECVTDSHGQTLCNNRNVDNSKDTITSDIDDLTSQDSSSSGSSSSSSSGGSSTICINGVCQSNDPNTAEKRSEIKSCSTRNGVQECRTETCVTADTGDLTCTVQTCTTDTTGIEQCTTGRSARTTRRQISTQTNGFQTKNWAYISKSLRLKPCLLSFLSEIIPLDFTKTAAAVATINAAVREATQGEIHSLVQPQDLVGAEFMLLNAVFFKGEWLAKFPVENTQTVPFFAPNSTREVNMMQVVGSFKYAYDTPLNASVVELPYSTSHSLLLLLPETREIGVERVVQTLTLKKLTETLNILKKSDIEVSLPRLSLRSHLSQEIKEGLAEMGITQLFKTQINLGTLTASRLRLKDIIHEAAIQVDEEGTTFAAATGLIGTRVGPAKFRCDRPFVFLLMDTRHNTILATGVYTSP